MMSHCNTMSCISLTFRSFVVIAAFSVTILSTSRSNCYDGILFDKQRDLVNRDYTVPLKRAGENSKENLNDLKYLSKRQGYIDAIGKRPTSDSRVNSAYMTGDTQQKEETESTKHRDELQEGESTKNREQMQEGEATENREQLQEEEAIENREQFQEEEDTEDREQFQEGSPASTDDVLIGKHRIRRGLGGKFDFDDRLRMSPSQMRRLRLKGGKNNETIPIVDTPATCQNRCSDDILTPCSCDITCFVYKSCCGDVSSACPLLEQEARMTMGDKLIDSTDYTSCDPVAGVFMVTRCPEINTVSPESQPSELFEYLQVNAVVYDNKTGLLFKNRAIYDCYYSEMDSVHPWEPTFPFFSTMLPYSNYLLLPSYLTPEYLVYTPPTESMAGHTCYPGAITSCESDLSFMDPNNTCGQFTRYTIPPEDYGIRKRRVYGNIYCYYCNTNRTDGVNDPQMKEISRNPYFIIVPEYIDENTFMLEQVLKPDRTWTKLVCTFSNTSDPLSQNPLMKSFPTCSIAGCRNETEVIDGECLSLRTEFVHLSHPPTPLPTSVIIDLARLITCRIQMMTWNMIAPRHIKIVRVGLLPPSERGIVKTPYGNISSSAFFSLNFEMFAPRHITPVTISLAALKAVCYFYDINKYTLNLGYKYPIFREYAGDDNDIERQRNIPRAEIKAATEKLLHDNPKVFLSALATNAKYFDYTTPTLKMVRPFNTKAIECSNPQINNNYYNINNSVSRKYNITAAFVNFIALLVIVTFF